MNKINNRAYRIKFNKKNNNNQNQRILLNLKLKDIILNNVLNKKMIKEFKN